MKGYTLIEFIIYIGLATVVLLSSLSFGWMILQDEIKQNVIAEVSYNSNFVQNKLLYHAKRANEIDAETTYGINPGVFVLNFPNTDQITIDTYNKDVMLGASEQSITKLRFTEGSDPSLDLTSQGRCDKFYNNKFGLAWCINRTN